MFIRNTKIGLIMRQKKLTSHVILLLLLGVLVSCDIFGVYQGTEDDEPNTSDADVVLGERVYNIHLGDSIKNIEKIYDRPDSLLLSNLSGLYRSWIGYQYSSGKLSGVKLYLYSDTLRRRTILNNGIVDWISLRSRSSHKFVHMSPFEGETMHGIGIGSDKATVRESLGDPASKLTEGIDYQLWFYCKEVDGQKNEIQISIEEDSVFFIGFGYHLPIDDSKGKDCVWEN